MYIAPLKLQARKFGKRLQNADNSDSGPSTAAGSGTDNPVLSRIRVPVEQLCVNHRQRETHILEFVILPLVLKIKH